MGTTNNSKTHDTTEGVAASHSHRPRPKQRWRRAPKLLASLLAVDILVLAWVLHPEPDEPRFATVAELAEAQCHALSNRLLHVQGTLVPKSLVAYTNPDECRFKITSSQDDDHAAQLEVVSQPCSASEYLRDVDGRPTRVTVIGHVQLPDADEPSVFATLSAALGAEQEPHRHASPEVAPLHLDARQIRVDVHGLFEAGASNAPHPTVRPVPTIER